MLKTMYDASSDRLAVQLDTPLPGENATHPQWAGFLDTLKAAGDLYTWKHEGKLAGFALPYGAFINAFKGKVPDPVLEEHQHIRRELAKVTTQQGGGLQVNFHQNSFDTDERSWDFTLNQEHFDQYVFNRVAWYAAPKNGIVTRFPLHVDLESASTCNMSCPMCYRDQLSKVGQMDFGLFTKAVDECAENGVYSLRLSWRGETLSHPRILDMIGYATERIPNVSFLTNAFYISDEVIEGLIEHQVAYVAVSFDGIGDIYEAVRAPAKFSESYAKLEKLRAKRQAAGSSKPQVRLCTIWPAVRDNPEAYRDAMRPVCDYMVCNPYINFKGPMRIKRDFICQYPWERIVIGFDGQAQCCTGWEADDILLGNVAEKSIKEMWNGPIMEKVRQKHSQGQRMELTSCAGCRHGSQGDEEADIWSIVDRAY